MLTANLLKGMSRGPVVRASHRTHAIAQHMMSTSSPLEVRPNLCFQRNLLTNLRTRVPSASGVV
jgi:hypothetical protein